MCDHVITFTFDVNIPNKNFYTSGITYESKKWVDLVEIDWVGRLKRRIDDIKTNWFGIVELKQIEWINKNIDYEMD